MNARMAAAVNDMLSSGRPKATADAYDPKTLEFEQFCEAVYPNDVYRYNLNAEKCYRFCYYQAFREKRKSGGNKFLRSQGLQFDVTDYRAVMGYFDNDNSDELFPQPTNPPSKHTFGQYKTVLKNLHCEQETRGVCALAWEHIWTLP